MTEVDVYRRRIDWHPFNDDEPRPLGRHVEHDPRSKDFAHKASGRPLVAVRHPRAIAVLDQGDLGSCTGNAGTGNLATTPLHEALPAPAPTLDESYAKALYSDAEKVDGGAGLPTEDNGSSGLSIAKVLTKRGKLIGGYKHSFSLADALDALQDGPLMIGSNWNDDMDHPDEHGVVTVGGATRGGHEYEADEYVPAGSPLEDGWIATEPMVGFDNSWGTGFGYRGRFYMTAANLGKLLKDEGDVTILQPYAASPAPTPGPSPEPDASFPGATVAATAHLARLRDEHGFATIGDYLNWRFGR